MRKTRSDKGKPRSTYNTKRTIAQTSSEKNEQIRWPSNPQFYFNAFYEANRISVTNEEAVKRAQEAEGNVFTKTGKPWHKRTIPLRTRWETKGEFIQRQLILLMSLQNIDVNDYRYLLPRAEHTATQTLTYITPPPLTLEAALQQTGIVRLPGTITIPLKEDTDDCSAEYADGYLYIALTEDMLDFKEDAIDWTPED